MPGPQSWEKGSLSNMGSKVCEFGSLYQTRVKITKTQIIYYRMEELITLHHGNFMILGKYAKAYTQRTGCSKLVGEWSIQSQLFLDEMKRECPGQNTRRQEWNLFLLEWMFQNTTAIWHKECQRQSNRLPLEPSEVAFEHPNEQTLVASRDTNLLQVVEQMYKGEYVVAPRVFTCTQCNDLMKELLKGPLWMPALGWHTRWKGASWIAF